jgi:4-hydroxybenzoate polyprenyltransferase
MGSGSTDALTARRPRWRAYALLARVSNLPTVWSNVLAGTMAATAAVFDTGSLVRVIAAASLFYMGGMFLNDAFDADTDAQARPERPLPAGDVSRGEAFLMGSALLVLALLLLATRTSTLLWGAVLAASIVLYDYGHKGEVFAPLVMGACRGLVYCVAASAAGSVTTAAAVGAAIMVVYVTGLTIVARLAGATARWLVPLMIAAISLVDAIFVWVVTRDAGMGLLAAAGFPATLLLQRIVPGD